MHLISATQSALLYRSAQMHTNSTFFVLMRIYAKRNESQLSWVLWQRHVETVSSYFLRQATIGVGTRIFCLWNDSNVFVYLHIGASHSTRVRRRQTISFAVSFVFCLSLCASRECVCGLCGLQCTFSRMCAIWCSFCYLCTIYRANNMCAWMSSSELMSNRNSFDFETLP